MTAKEKAQELYNKYEFVYIQNYTSKHEVKQCALIAIDEMTSQLAEINNMESFNVSKYGNYWHEVKQEINKL